MPMIRPRSDVVYGICRGLPSARPCDVKRHCTGLFLGLMAAPISMLTSSTLDGCDFYNPCSYLVTPKLYFIEIEVNSIKGKICTLLK